MMNYVYVYLLSFYGEHGSEEVKATLDRGRLHAMIDSYDLSKSPIDSDAYHKALDEMLLDGDDVLSASRTYCDDSKTQGPMPHNLSDGWGGMQLHVVRLDEAQTKK